MTIALHGENARSAMPNPRTKGKIPHGEWPQILAKYAGGNTIAQIARDYGCTAPAIRYIIKRSGKLKGESGRAGSRLQASSGIMAGGRNKTVSAAARPRLAARTGCRTKAGLLRTELVTRVTGDVVSFFAALDHAVLESSVESLSVLQEAIDALMRSAARTRIEVGRILNPDEVATPRHDDVVSTDENLRLS